MHLMRFTRLPKPVHGGLTGNLDGSCDMFGQEKGEALPAAMRAVAARRLLERVAEAYGRMLLLNGLFQADCHPGNIFVKPNGHLGAHVHQPAEL